MKTKMMFLRILAKYAWWVWGCPNKMSVRHLAADLQGDMQMFRIDLIEQDGV